MDGRMEPKSRGLPRTMLWTFLFYLQRDDTQRFCNNLIDVEHIQQKEFANKGNARNQIRASHYKPVKAHLIKVRIRFGVFQTWSKIVFLQILRIKENKFHDFNWVLKELPLFLLFIGIGVYLFVYFTSDGAYARNVMEKMISGNYTPGKLPLNDVFNHNT